MQNIKATQKNKTLANFWKKSLSQKEKTLLTRQLASLQNAGIPLVEALKMIIKTSKPGFFKSRLRKITYDLEKGASFSNTLKKYPLDFDHLYCCLIESGEQTGSLDIMLTRMAESLEKTASLRLKIKKALYYPITVMIITFLVTFILLTKVVPLFQELFKSQGVELPFFTRCLLYISNGFVQYGLETLLLLLALIIIFSKFYKSNLAFKKQVQNCILKSPILGPLISKIQIIRFANTLSLTLSCGIPLSEALPVIANAANTLTFTSAIQRAKEDLMMGYTLNVALKKTKIFPESLIQFVHIGEASGQLDLMLAKIATIFQEEVDSLIEGLTSLLEPIMMTILGILVGGLIIALYLPIFNMGSLF